MRFSELELPGVFLVEVEPHVDERGWFARAYCAREFAEHGLEPVAVQTNLSYNARGGTLRGMHYQDESAPEAKLVRCLRGAIHDVVVDLRPGSPTRLRSVATDLTADDGRALYVPPLFAHGFQALADDTLVTYQVSAFHTPAAERGLRHDDPALGIDWPRPVTVVSDKDRAWPLLDPAAG